MNGLELSKAYFEEFGKEMLETSFSELLPYLAVGFVGSGSEHFGFDDEISQDHDFEPGFCIFLPSEDIVDRKQEFQLERAYAKLPQEFCGIKRLRMSPVGGNRNGVIRTAEFYQNAVGSSNGELSVDAWLHIPDFALADATNGEVYFDNFGEFTRIRENLKNMPDDIKLKRLAGNLLIMAQSGQYNFVRCQKHNEFEASQLACVEFVNATLKTLFLLNDTYMPYYKWSFRSLRQFYKMDLFADLLSFLLFGDSSSAEQKYDTIERIASMIIDLLQAKNLTDAICGDLEKHAYSVNDKISDNDIRNMHILTAI